MKTKVLFATLLTLVLFTDGHAQTLDKAKLDQFLDRLAEKNKGMGSLTLAKEGNVIYSHSFGHSQIDGNKKRPLTAETKYRIASITKMYTAVMIFQLVEEQKLRLADTLDKFFPQIPNAARITIGQILTHRSGIHDIEAEREGLIEAPPRRDSGYRTYPPDTVDRVRFIMRAKELGFSLKEIKELMALRLAPGATCGQVKRREEAKIADIQDKIRSLERMRQALEKLTAACGRKGSVSECPILEALEDGDNR